MIEHERHRGGALVSAPCDALGVGISVDGLAFEERLFRKSASRQSGSSKR
jgi:hypothetical protein